MPTKIQVIPDRAEDLKDLPRGISAPPEVTGDDVSYACAINAMAAHRDDTDHKRLVGKKRTEWTCHSCVLTRVSLEVEIHRPLLYLATCSTSFVEVGGRSSHLDHRLQGQERRFDQPSAESMR